MTTALTPSTNGKGDLTDRRIQVFEAEYGPEALMLAYHAAFPLTLTSDLIYCLRENFVPQCPWYAAADVLISGLCNPIGHDLYEMEGASRDRLLRRLCVQAGEQRLYDLQDFMAEYIQHRVQVEQSQRPRLLGDQPHWTALACLRPGEAVEVIRRELQRLTATGDIKERLRLAALVESYADLLSEVGFQPVLLDLAHRTAEGKAIEGNEAAIAAALGVTLEFFEFEVIKIAFDDQPSDKLRPFEFETVTVNARGQVISKEMQRAYCFEEALGENISPLEMVAIPGGTFEMGSPENEPERYDDESPQHTVTVPPFFISKYLVTQAQWRFVAQLSQINRELELNPSQFEGDDRPVEQVSWLDVVEFCDRLSHHTGREYRLPSEAEWEYACRAGTTTPFCFWETITTELVNYDGNTTYREGPQGEYREETTPVGSFPPNAFGLFDMHGNVLEWCADHWHESYKDAPDNGSAWVTNDEDAARVYRGGSWNDYPWDCRSAYRYRDDPDFRCCYLGFRVVCSPPRTL